MKRSILHVFWALGLWACGPDETISGFAETDIAYGLTEIDGAPFTAPAAISFGDDGAVTGIGPCNTFSTTQNVPYPWFELTPLTSTRKACPNLPQETLYFEALMAMELAEVVGDVLILSTVDGREMVFQAE